MALPQNLTKELNCNRHTLYAESCRITPAPPVLPRLLAQSWPGLSILQIQSLSSLAKMVLRQYAFCSSKEVSLDQAFANCPKFLTADLRRSLGHISVPMWLAVFPYQLKIISLVGFYPTNNLILHQLI